MKRILMAIGVILVLAMAGTYFYFSGKEYVYRFSEDDIRAKLAEKLPFKRTYLFIFEVTLEHPRVTLRDGSDRIAAGLDVTLGIHVGGSSKPLGGSIDASGALAFDASKGAFYLTDPVIEKLEIQGLPEAYAKKASAVVAESLADYYREHPVYTLGRTDVRQALARAVLKKAEIHDRTVIVTIGI